MNATRQKDAFINKTNHDSVDASERGHFAMFASRESDHEADFFDGVSAYGAAEHDAAYGAADL